MAVPKTFSVENTGKTLIIRPLDTVGSLAEPNIKSELDELVEQLHDPQIQSVVIDLEHLPYFGTNMLETMHIIWRPVRAKGGKMVLCNVSDVGREILRVARFDVLWPVVESPEQAIQTAAKA